MFENISLNSKKREEHTIESKNNHYNDIVPFKLVYIFPSTVIQNGLVSEAHEPITCG